MKVFRDFGEVSEKSNFYLIIEKKSVILSIKIYTI